MLAPYMKIPTQKAQLLSNDEESIINSFYEERKARSNNHKYHNLLKKNISFFHPENNREGDSTYTPINRQSNDHEVLKRQERKMSQPPLPPQHMPTSIYTEVPHKQSRTKSQFLAPITIPNENCIIGAQVNSTKNADQKYKQHLKNQLNKRININQYLKNWEEEDKENLQKSQNKESEEMLEHIIYKKRTESELGAKKIGVHNISKNLEHERSLASHANSSVLDQCSRISHRISRVSFQQGDCMPIIDKSIEEIKAERLLQSKNIISQTNHCEKIRHTFGSAHSSRGKSQSSLESPLSSHPKRLYQTKNQTNCLTSQQLSELHQNSYPLREEPQRNQPKPLPSSYTLKYNYIDPEQEMHYKRRIQDLELELEELKAKHKKEDKFIQSIIKMRRVMLDCPDQECSLKQLWRWIKQLPRK